MCNEVAQMPSLRAQNIRRDSLFLLKERKRELLEMAMSFIRPAGLEEVAIFYPFKAS